MAEQDIGDRAIGRMGGPAGDGRSEGSEGLRHDAAGIGRDAREAVAGPLTSARDMAADNVRRAAEALHAAAGSMGQGDTFGGLIDAAASRLDDASDALRGRDLGRLVQDVNAFARRQPALFIGGALLAGIALGRFAAAGMGTSPRHGEGRSADTGAVQEGRLSGAIGGTRGDRMTGEPPTTVPGHAARGARPQPRGSLSGMPADE